MIIYAIILGIFSAITMVFSFLGDPVTQLPWGIDTPLSFFMTTINDIIYVMPWLEIVWTIFLLALGIKIAEFILQWVLYLIKLIRG